MLFIMNNSVTFLYVIYIFKKIMVSINSQKKFTWILKYTSVLNLILDRQEKKGENKPKKINKKVIAIVQQYKLLSTIIYTYSEIQVHLFSACKFIIINYFQNIVIQIIEILK